MTKSVKPTVDDVLALLERCRTIYGPLQQQFEEDEKFYELEFKDDLRLPEEFEDEGIVLPTTRDMVDTCVDYTDVGNAKIFVNKKGAYKTDEKVAEQLRKFYLGVIHRTDTENSISPWRVAAKHYWLHGLACLKTVWDADRWRDKPEREAKESEDTYAARIDKWRNEGPGQLPIVIQAVNPHNIFPDPYEGGGRFIIEVSEKLVMDVKSKFPRWSNPVGKTLDQTVEHVSFWTKEYRCELYDKEPILPVKGGVVKHSYGFIPYVLIDTGLGNLDHKNDPKKRYVGILRHMRDLAISESRNYSISDVVLAKTAWPWGVITGKGAEGVTDLDQKFGTYTPLPEGVELVPQTPQVPPAALNEHMAITAGYIASHAAPNSVRGMGEQGVRSAVDRRQVIQAAATRYIYSNQAFRNGAAKVLTNCARVFLNVLPGDVRIWARTPTDEFDIELDKKAFKEPFTCYVEFAPRDDEDEYRKHDDLERLVASGIVVPKWARTQMPNVDPQAMEFDEEVEKLKKDPNIGMMVSQYATSKLLEALTKRSVAEAKKNPPPAMPNTMGSPAVPGEEGQSEGPPSGQTPVPNMPGMGSPEMMQNQLADLRRPKPVNPNQGQGGGGNR